MPNKLFSVPPIALLALLAVGPVHGDTMECGGGIIDSAESDPPGREEVRRKCGEPDGIYDEGYRWVYQRPQWVYTLQFDNRGDLMMIQREHPDGEQ